MLGLAWGEEITLARTRLVEAAIADGRLTVLEEVHAGTELRGEELDEALRAHGLPTHGLVRAKRSRLTRHLHSEHPATVTAGDPTPPAGAADRTDPDSPTDADGDDGDHGGDAGEG
jgi:hypothetical protein